jgi:hypothetical protein
VTLEEAAYAAVGILFGGGGAAGIARARSGRQEERATASATVRDEATIRREAKMEAAVENLLATSKELLDEVKALRKAKHEHANTLQHHETRIAEIERSLRVDSGPIRVNDR